MIIVFIFSFNSFEIFCSVCNSLSEVQELSEEEQALWEEDEKRLDREWYNIDEGYDDDFNPFSRMSNEYVKKKEETLEQKKKKRISAQQRQINKVAITSYQTFAKVLSTDETIIHLLSCRIMKNGRRTGC